MNLCKNSCLSEAGNEQKSDSTPGQTLHLFRVLLTVSFSYSTFKWDHFRNRSHADGRSVDRNGSQHWHLFKMKWIWMKLILLNFVWCAFFACPSLTPAIDLTMFGSEKNETESCLFMRSMYQCLCYFLYWIGPLKCALALWRRNKWSDKSARSTQPPTQFGGVNLAWWNGTKSLIRLHPPRLHSFCKWQFIYRM